jgi:hypothetical protein
MCGTHHPPSFQVSHGDYGHCSRPSLGRCVGSKGLKIPGSELAGIKSYTPQGAIFPQFTMRLPQLTLSVPISGQDFDYSPQSSMGLCWGSIGLELTGFERVAVKSYTAPGAPPPPPHPTFRPTVTHCPHSSPGVMAGRGPAPFCGTVSPCYGPQASGSEHTAMQRYGKVTDTQFLVTVRSTQPCRVLISLPNPTLML